MDNSQSIIIEHYDLMEYFDRDILASSSSFQSIEDYDERTKVRVRTELLKQFLFDINLHTQTCLHTGQ